MENDDELLDIARDLLLGLLMLTYLPFWLKDRKAAQLGQQNSL